MGETPIILLPVVVAPEPHKNQNRTLSDFAIVAFFHVKRKPPPGMTRVFPPDFAAIVSCRADCLRDDASWRP